MNDLIRSIKAARCARENGFTFIEMLVVIGVLALMASIVILNILGFTNRGATAACQTDLKSVQTAVIAYYNDHGNSYPTSGGSAPGGVVMGDLAPVYLHTAPTTTGAVTIDALGTTSATNC
jgi:general secretion pathway protein G